MVSTFVLVALMAMPSDPGPRGRDVTEKVDLIELNHSYDDLGRHAYDQVIFYEWSPDYRRFHVIAWCLIDNDISRLPTRNSNNGEYIVRWHDRDAKMRREVHSPLYRETWSQVNLDPERVNKKLLDEKYRASLLRLPQREVVQR